MPGEGGRFTQKEDRQTEHVKEREDKRPHPHNDVEPVGYGTINTQVNKQKGGNRKGKK